MIYLNAGNLWSDDYLDQVIMLNDLFKSTVQVKSLFGSIAGLTPTARAVDRLPYRDWAFIDRYVDRAQKNGIAIRYTLNQSCIGSTQDFKADWNGKLWADVTELHNVGVHEWTVTSPLIMELLREMFPSDFLEVSTIAEVANAEEASRWLKLGADGVNISTSINRDFLAIRSIVETGIKVSILANEACLYRCPWRRECYNLSSHNSQRSEDLFGFYPFRRCNEVRIAHPDEWIKSRLVLPQWMKFYQEHIKVNWFKVAYRTHPIEVAMPMLRAYMKEHFIGNLLELWPTISPLGDTIEPRDLTFISCRRLDEVGFIQDFIELGAHCSEHICGDTCKYCEHVYRMTQGQ